MPTKIYKPKGRLEGLVEFFWYCNGRVEKLDCVTLPIPHVEIVFNYSDEYIVRRKDGSGLLNNSPAWIAGLQSISNTTKIAGTNENAGVVFTPTGISAFTKIPITEFSKRHLPLEAFWNGEARELYQQVGDCPDIQRKFNLLEGFLIKKLIPHNPNSNLLHAVKLLNDASSSTRINQLCKTLNLSRKSLNNLFTRYIGIPAGEYKRLLIFNRTLKELNNLCDQKLSDVAYALDYFDQSHFIREFSSFSGMTPGNYLKCVHNLATSKEEPNFILQQG